MIDIIIQDSERVNAKKSAFLRFKYNKEILQKVKSLPERYWNMGTKMWEIPEKDITYLQMILPSEDFNITVRKYDRPIPSNYSFKVKPLPYQKEAIVYGINHDNFLNGDQQGLGKTYEALMVSEIRKEELKQFCDDRKIPFTFHTLIVCGVNSLRHNWKREIERFTNEQSHIIGERLTKTGNTKAASTADKLEDLENIDSLPYYLIINVESLRNERIADKLSDLCVDGIFMVIFDEIHKCRSPKSITGRNLLRLNAKYKVGLSGTPMVNNPMDFYLFLRWIGVEQRNYWQFSQYYQIWKEIRVRREVEDGITYETIKVPVGYRHLDEIQMKMDNYMIRRTKKDVLELPRKIYRKEYLEMGPKQQKIYDEIFTGMLKEVDKIKASPNPLVEFIRLRQATSDCSLVSSGVNESVKLDRMEDIVEETIQNGEKLLIFTTYQETARNAAKRLRKYKPAMIMQDTKDVEKEKQKFRDSTDILIGTIGVMGTGHTLTEAGTVLFLEQPWTSADLEQAEDRAHRIGQDKPVTYITLLCKDTIDERVDEILDQKKDLSNMLVDKEKKLSVEYLLKR